MYGKVLWILASAVVLNACTPQLKGLNKASKICRERGLTAGTEAYSTCLLFEDERLAEEEYQQRLRIKDFQ